MRNTNREIRKKFLLSKVGDKGFEIIGLGDIHPQGNDQIMTYIPLPEYNVCLVKLAITDTVKGIRVMHSGQTDNPDKLMRKLNWFKDYKGEINDVIEQLKKEGWIYQNHSNTFRFVSMSLDSVVIGVFY